MKEYKNRKNEMQKIEARVELFVLKMNLPYIGVSGGLSSSPKIQLSILVIAAFWITIINESNNVFYSFWLLIYCLCMQWLHGIGVNETIIDESNL